MEKEVIKKYKHINKVIMGFTAREFDEHRFDMAM